MTESKLAKKWVERLRLECAKVGRHILIINVHGHRFQERGISDYLICYKGRWFSVEFKNKTKLTAYQEDFLERTKLADGIGLLIQFDQDGYYIRTNHYSMPGTHWFKAGEEKYLLDSLIDTR